MHCMMSTMKILVVTRIQLEKSIKEQMQFETN
jgi:hypothetical protein